MSPQDLVLRSSLACESCGLHGHLVVVAVRSRSGDLLIADSRLSDEDFARDPLAAPELLE
jgi:hypothetical protein